MTPDLKICEKCGWHEHGKYGEQCFPEKGKAVKAVLAEVTDVENSQLGVGTGNFSFKPDGLLLIMGVRDIKDSIYFTWEDVYCHQDLRHEDIVDLARTLNDWNNRVRARNGENQ